MVCKGFRECHYQNIQIRGCNACLTVTNEQNPTVKERRVTYSIKNNKRLDVFIYAVDGKLIAGVDEIRCDYLLMAAHCKKAFFVELKGSDWKHALKQLENTVFLLYPEMKEYTPHLRAVVRRSAPNTTYNQLMKMRKDMQKRYAGATVEVKSRFDDEV